MLLYFQDSYGKYRLISDSVDKSNVFEKIRSYINGLNPKFEIFYIRSWEIPQGTMYDVGSHTEFFILTDRRLYKSEYSI